MDKVSYALGIGIGHQLANMGGQALNIDDFAQAVKDVLGGNELKIKSSEAQQIVQAFFAEQEEKINKQRQEAGKMAKEEVSGRECQEGRCCYSSQRSAVSGTEGR